VCAYKQEGKSMTPIEKVEELKQTIFSANQALILDKTHELVHLLNKAEIQVQDLQLLLRNLAPALEQTNK
jgi:hypothetical protein